MNKLLLALLLGTAATAQVPPPTYADVVYKRLDTLSLRLDVYRPDSGTRPAPAMLWLHGGGWREGTKRNPRPIELLRDGFVVVSVQYRLSHVAPFPAQLLDAKDAVKFIRQNAARYGIDPARIGVWGNSAGGQLAALLGTSGDARIFERQCAIRGVSSRVQAVIDECGPTDFRRHLALLKQRDPSENPDDPTSLYYQYFGGPVSTRRRLVRLANPISFVSPDAPPFLLIHGDQDPVVPIENSQWLEAALRRKGVPVRFLVQPGIKHDVRKALSLESIRSFVRTSLGAP
jgi:acetyl esterase/lipase